MQYKDIFFYQRKVSYKWPVPNWTPESGVPETETRTTIVWDCFNISKVVSGRWASIFTFEILLDDGHEQAEDVQKEIRKDNKVVGHETKRERGWYITKIELTGNDIYRFRAASELILNKEEAEYFESLLPPNPNIPIAPIEQPKKDEPQY